MIAGHGRLLAAQHLGLSEVPVIRLSHLKSEQARSYRVADNQLVLAGAWDEELLAAELHALNAAGVRRINVSVDSLDALRFRAITRRGRLAQVLDGLAAAKAAGLEVKINTVALKGINDDEFDALIA